MAGRFSVEAVFKAVDRITAPVSRMQNRIGKFTRGMERGLHSVNRAVDKTVAGMKRVAGAAIKFGAAGLTAATGAVTFFVREFSKIEDAEAAFTPLLGGAKRAKELVDALNKTSATTPFQFENLADTAKQLLPVMNGDIENTIKTIRMLGDTAGGNAQKLDSITRGFTKAMLKGKVDMESLNMIAEAGVPIFQDLADVMGTEVNESLFKMISAGKVTTQQLTLAFERMTGEGGKFFKGMEISSKTTSGVWSTMIDNISLAAAEIGSALAPAVKELLGEVTKVAQRVKEWAKQNKGLILDRAIEFVRNLTQNTGAFIKEAKKVGKIVVIVASLILALKALVAIMTIVNLVMTMNPIGLMIVGIGLLIAAIAALVIWWDEVKAAVIEFGQAVMERFSKLPGPVKAAIVALMGPIGWLIAAAKLVMDSWGPIKDFFTDLWGGVTSAFASALDFITGVVEKVISKATAIIDTIKSIGSGVTSFFKFDDETEDRARSNSTGSQVVSPGERVARSIEEHRTTSAAEVTIRDETGRAEVTGGTLGPGLALQPSGAF